MGRFYWDNPVQHDRPLITNCFVPGLACAAGINPSSAIEERDTRHAAHEHRSC